MAIKLPYMPFYGFDYETDPRCKMLTAAEHGTYLLLLWEQWKEGSIPADPTVAAQLIRSTDVLTVGRILERFFEPSDEAGTVFNRKLYGIRRVIEAERLAKSRGGKRGRKRQMVQVAPRPEPPPLVLAPEPEPPPKKPPPVTPAKKGQPTWLTPYWDAWIAAYGGKPAAGPLSKSLKPLHDEHGEAITLVHWKSYLAQTDAQYASPARFASTFARWADNPDSADVYAGVSFDAPGGP